MNKPGRIDLAYSAYLQGSLEKQAMFGTAFKLGGKFLRSAFGKAVESVPKSFQGLKRISRTIGPDVEQASSVGANRNLAIRQNMSGGIDSLMGTGINASKAPKITTRNLAADKHFLNQHFQSAAGSPVTRSAFETKRYDEWLKGMDPEFSKHLKTYTPRAGGDANAAYQNFARDIYGRGSTTGLGRLSDPESAKLFEKLMQRHGKIPDSYADHLAEYYGRRVGGVAGPLGITMPLGLAPYTAAEWAGNYAAKDEAQQAGIDSAKATVGRQVANFAELPIMDRLNMLLQPQEYSQQALDNNPHLASFYNSLFSAAPSQIPKIPGLFDYVKHMVNPMLFRNPAQEHIVGQGINGMRKYTQPFIN